MSRKMLFFSSIIFLLSVVESERIVYENYRVYRIQPKSPAQVNLLKKIDGSSDSVVFLEGVNSPLQQINVVVSPHKNSDFISTMNKYDIPHLLIEDNIQRTLTMDNKINIARSNKYGWTNYYSLNETYDWLEKVQKTWPHIIQPIVAGKTYEGREIRGLKLSYKTGNKGIILEGGMHAREWISPATVTYILNELLTSNDSVIQKLAQKYDWYIIPVTNPDGYVYTHEVDRLWRKTRSKNGNCYGADPNRNWDFKWMEIGASSHPCSETYAGSGPFSEIETRSLSEYIATLKGKIQLFFSFHAFSQLLMFPFGHTNKHISNHNDHQRISDVGVKALAKRYGTQYKTGHIYEAIYPASGASVDWAYAVLQIPLAFTYELRPVSDDWNGFILDEQYIIPTAEETLDSLVAMILEAEVLGY